MIIFYLRECVWPLTIILALLLEYSTSVKIVSTVLYGNFFYFFFTFYSFLYTYTAAKWDTTLPAILIWQQFNKKPHYIYQIWWKDLLTPQSLEIRFTFGSQPHTRDDVSCHWFIYKKTLWFNGLPFQSSVMTHLIWILCSCTFKMLT